MHRERKSQEFIFQDSSLVGQHDPFAPRCRRAILLQSKSPFACVARTVLCILIPIDCSFHHSNEMLAQLMCMTPSWPNLVLACARSLIRCFYSLALALGAVHVVSISRLSRSSCAWPNFIRRLPLPSIRSRYTRSELLFEIQLEYRVQCEQFNVHTRHTHTPFSQSVSQTHSVNVNDGIASYILLFYLRTPYAAQFPNCFRFISIYAYSRIIVIFCVKW